MPNTTGKILEIRVCEKGDKANLTNSALVNFAKTVCDFLIFTTEHCLAKGGFKGCGENPNSPHVILPSSTECDIREAKRTAMDPLDGQSKDPVLF